MGDATATTTTTAAAAAVAEQQSQPPATAIPIEMVAQGACARSGKDSCGKDPSTAADYARVGKVSCNNRTLGATPVQATMDAATAVSKKSSRPDSPLPVSITSSPGPLSVRSSATSQSSRNWWGGVVEEAGTSPEPYFCQICLEDRPAGPGFQLSACQHSYCRACLKAYVTSKITDGQVYPKCFHLVDDEGRGSGAKGSDGRHREDRAGRPLVCGAVISQGDIRSLLVSDRATRRKYTRFLFCRENLTARECPRCSRLQVGDPENVEMQCTNSRCRKAFCYDHGGAHEGKTCAEHLEATADETSRTLALIGRLTKPCPGCQTPVEKLGGCNQMVCYHCNSSFCWICGQEVDRGTFPVHFQWWNVRGCPNQQLQEDTQQAGGGRQCHQALSVLQIIIVGPPALLLTVASSLACVCCLPAFKLPPRQLFTGCFSGWGNFVMMLPILPFVFAGFVVAGIVYLILLPFRLASAISRKYRKYRMERHCTKANGGGSSSSNSSSRITAASGRAVVGGARAGPQGVPGTLEDGVKVADVDADDMNSSIVGSRPAGSLSPVAAMLRAERRHRREQKAIAERQQHDPRHPSSSFSSSSLGSNHHLASRAAAGGSLSSSASSAAVVPPFAPPPPPEVALSVVPPPRRSSRGGVGGVGVSDEEEGGGLPSSVVVEEEGEEASGLEMPRISAMGVMEMMGRLFGASPVSLSSPRGAAATLATPATPAALEAERNSLEMRRDSVGGKDGCDFDGVDSSARHGGSVVPPRGDGAIPVANAV